MTFESSNNTPCENQEPEIPHMTYKEAKAKGHILIRKGKVLPAPGRTWAVPKKEWPENKNNWATIKKPKKRISRKAKINNRLRYLAHELGIKGIYLPGNYKYNLNDVEKHIPNIKRAIKLLTDEEIKILSKFYIALGEQGISSWLDKDGVKLTKEDVFVVQIDYNANPSKILSVIRKSLKTINTVDIAISKNAKSKFGKFYKDYRLQNMSDIDIPDRSLNKRQRNEFKIMIARNLYIQGKEPTPKNIQEEYKAILEKRKLYKNIPLFRGRNVLCVAHNEEFRDKGDEYSEAKYKLFERAAGGKHRFMTKATLAKIKKQGGKIDLIRADKSLESLKEKEADIKRKIINTPPPFTFMFDGHGQNNKISLAKDGPGLTVWEIADCIAERYKKFPQLKNAIPSMQDIFIFHCCYGHNYLKRVYSKLKNKISSDEYTLPIMFSAAEYGQLGWGKFNNRYGTYTFSRVLNLRSKNQISTLGTIMDKGHLSRANPTLFIPSRVNKMMQVASKKSKSKPDQASA